MPWRTGCVGCGPACGGRGRHSEPERAGGEQADARAAPSTAEARWKGGGRGSRRCGWLPRHWSCALGLFLRGGGSSDFASTRAHGTEADPGNGGNGSPETSPQTKTQEQAVETRCRRCRFLCANNSGRDRKSVVEGKRGE